MTKNKFIFLLLAIIALGAILRLWGLGGLPRGFFRDEAALGYNAFSIWETGKDEYGVSFPVVFRSFEVFFLPLYVYLSAPIVGFFGLTETTTRLISAFSGVALLFIAYLIVKPIWDRKSALLTAFVLAISPWHIFYSRGAFEGNLALTLFAGGFLFWFKFLEREKVKLFYASTLLFAFSMYSYQSERVVVPFFALAALAISRKKLWRLKNRLILPTLVLLIFLIPLLSLSFKAGGYHRAFGVSVFETQEKPPGFIDELGSESILNDTYYLRGRQILSLYLTYFSPRNLFFEGDYDRQRSVGNQSVFYAWMFPFLIVGLWSVLKKKNEFSKNLVIWTLLAPIPAAITGDPFHTYRSLLLYLPLTIFIGVGISEVAKGLKARGKYFIFLVNLVGLGSLSLFWFNYAVLTQSSRARSWDYGYKEISSFIDSLSPETKVVVDDPWTEGYIHYLFFNKVGPRKYHEEVNLLGNPESYYYSDPSEIRPKSIGSVEFRKVSWSEERGDSGKVFIFWAESLPESEFRGDPNIELLKEIKYPSGEISYRIVRVK